MSWRTASYFSSRPTAATNSSQLLTAIPGTPRACRGPCSFAETRTGSRAGANQGDHSPGDFSHFCLKICAPRRLSAAGPVRCPLPALLGAWPQPLNTPNIDAFNGKTVTPKTLLRYTFKSRLVNVLIRGFLWKTCRPGLILQTLLEGGWGGFGAFTWGCSPRHRGLFLRPRRAKASLGRGHVLLDDSRLR